MKRMSALLLGWPLFALAGCGDAATPNPASPAPGPTPVAAAPAVAPAVAPTVVTPTAPGPSPATLPSAPSAPTAATAAPGTELVKAETGVGAKGRGYGGGMITEPVRQYFRIPQKIVFDIQIPDALNKFKALNDRAPQSHEEFMKEIIEANSIKLPKLPDGDSYFYDAATGELMVQRPKG